MEISGSEKERIRALALAKHNALVEQFIADLEATDVLFSGGTIVLEVEIPAVIGTVKREGAPGSKDVYETQRADGGQDAKIGGGFPR